MTSRWSVRKARLPEDEAAHQRTVRQADLLVQPLFMSVIRLPGVADCSRQSLALARHSFRIRGQWQYACMLTGAPDVPLAIGLQAAGDCRLVPADELWNETVSPDCRPSAQLMYLARLTICSAPGWLASAGHWRAPWP